MLSRAALRRRAVISALLLLVIYLFAWPVPIDPVAWEPPTDRGYVDRFASNDSLSALEFVPVLDAEGPEAMTTDRLGRIYAATSDGRIVRLSADGTTPMEFVNTGGRPLGMAFDARGTMWVADAKRGLLTVGTDGSVRVAAAMVGDDTIRLADDLDVATDGRVYLSDASTRFFPPRYDAFEASLLEILEHRGGGRLLEHDPATGLTRVLLDSLVFANGVALSHDQRSVLVAETGSYRILRVVRDGPDRGQATVLIDNLPGFPDNITRGRDGRYWVALVAPRNALVDRLAGRPFLRAMLQRLPKFLHPKPVHHGHVIAVDDSGRVVANLQDPSGRLPMLTSALEVRITPSYLYLGSLQAPTAARLRWDPPATPRP